MSLLVIAYPEIDEAGWAWIQQYRKMHDSLYYTTVNPHITFVFAAEGISDTEFVEEVVSIASKYNPILFDISKAIVHKDAFKDFYHEFLIPGEGYRQIADLHDALYAGKLNPCLRTDIEYIPHITIGNAASYQTSLQRVESINVGSVNIRGVISQLSVVRYINNQLSLLKLIPLKSNHL